jgi:hypothetical protein
MNNNLLLFLFTVLIVIYFINNNENFGVPGFIRTYQINAPKTTVPQTTAPKKVPQTTAPKKVPQTTAPQTTVPQTNDPFILKLISIDDLISQLQSLPNKKPEIDDIIRNLKELQKYTSMTINLYDDIKSANNTNDKSTLNKIIFKIASDIVFANPNTFPKPIDTSQYTPQQIIDQY